MQPKNFNVMLTKRHWQTLDYDMVLCFCIFNIRFHFSNSILALFCFDVIFRLLGTFLQLSPFSRGFVFIFCLVDFNLFEKLTYILWTTLPFLTKQLYRIIYQIPPFHVSLSSWWMNHMKMCLLMLHIQIQP